MVRNVQATSATGLRKNRVTQKTRLRVVRGQLDTDALVLDDEEERNKVLASQGVDAEDANEHHLQAVLNSHRKHAGDTPGKQTAAHIPVPDAAGVVEGYETLYPSAKCKQPTTHLRFSDSVEETVDGGLAGGFSYFLDERDAEWLDKNNQEARGEGTSASASSSANGAAEEILSASTRGWRRGTRGKGKDPEHVHAHASVRVAVDEDEFELVMGLFEKLTEEKYPFIHLALDNFPAFADYEPAFAAPLPRATFASYLVPASVPPPERLVLVAHSVYPHWKARKVEREGQRVVPQLDYDDSHESSYICFRRRDAKPVRRTRASSTAYTDKLARLRAELHVGLDLAKMVLEREELKTDAAGATQEVWRARSRLVEEWHAGDNKGQGMGIDESLLFDRERVRKKPKVEGLGRIILGLNRRPTGPQSSVTPNGEQHSPLTTHLDLSTVNSLTSQAYVATQSKVHERHKGVQANVEREIASLRARDNGWEDLLDLPYQAMPVPSSEKLFRSCLPRSVVTGPSTPSPPSFGIDPAATTLLDSDEILKSPPPFHRVAYEAPLPPPAVPFDVSPPHESPSIHSSVSPVPERAPRSLRLRTGRGGRLHLDRRLHTSRTHPLVNVERARWPCTSSRASLHQRRDDWERDEKARWENRDWRPEHGRSSGKGKGKGNARKLGEESWTHASMYVDREVELRKRKRAECEEESIGFEQSGYGLGFVASAEWEKGPAFEGMEWRAEKRHRGNGGSGSEESESVEWPMEGRTGDDVERARRVDERWRYDAEVGRAEDRYLLDDFQPKFLRTMITLLDAVDHDAIKTDSKYLAPSLVPDATPKATRSSSRLGEQERSRMISLKGQRVTPLQLQHPPMLPSHPPVFQTPPVPSTTPPLPLPQIASGRMDEQIRKMARQTPSVSPTTASTPQASQRMSVPQVSPVTSAPSHPNGVPLKPAPYTNGVAGDNGATVRVSTAARPKSHTPSPQQPQSQQGIGVNGFGPHQPPNHLALHPGHAHGLNSQQYATLRNVFADRVPGAQQQQQGRGQIPMAGANVNLQMAPGALNLKLPPTRPGQLRMNGAVGGETNVGGQPMPMHATPPHPNGNSPILAHARGPSVNGHLMAPNNGRASPVNAHLLGRASPLAHATLSSSHHHSHIVPLHSSPQPRPTAPLAHQQVVGGAGQGHGYS